MMINGQRNINVQYSTVNYDGRNLKTVVSTMWRIKEYDILLILNVFVMWKVKVYPVRQ